MTMHPQEEIRFLNGVVTGLIQERTETLKKIEVLTARVKELEKALTDVGSSLVAAISLLEGGGKKAAPSDKMFRVMLSDYRKSVKRARAEDGGVRE